MRIKLKKVRTKCMVKGCRNSGNKVATYNVSASHEFGKGVIMCTECIKSANEALVVMQTRVEEAALPQSADTDSPLGEGAKQPVTKKRSRKKVDA